MTDDRRKRQPTGDYHVGYCRPPEATRWKPGQSGRPAGKLSKKAKPQRSTDFSALLRHELLQTVDAWEGDEKVQIHVLDLLAKCFVKDLLQATPAQRLKLVKELNQLGILSPGPEAYATSAGAIERFVQRLAQEHQLEEDGNGYRYPK